MSAVIDASALFAMRRRHAVRARSPVAGRQARASDAERIPLYTPLMLKNLSLGELAHRLRDTGLVLSDGPIGMPVLHEFDPPPPAA